MVVLLVLLLAGLGLWAAAPAARTDLPPPAPPLAVAPGVEVWFPKQIVVPGPHKSPGLSLTGRLVLEGRCLRVIEEAGGVSYLPVWRADFAPAVDAQGQLVLQDGAGRTLYRVGEPVHLGGGGFAAGDRQWFEGTEYVRRRLPDACPGPYWLVDPPDARTLTPPAG